MAQQSARRGRKNQVYSSCPEHAFMIWFRSANSHTGPQLHRCTIRAGQMAASDYVPIFFKNRLHLAGRPQVSMCPSAHMRDGFLAVMNSMLLILLALWVGASLGII